MRKQLGTDRIFGWHENDGIVYFDVTSDGTTGEDWIKRLESKGFRIGNPAKSVLCSSNFKQTNGIVTRIAVLKGVFFDINDLISKKILSEAKKRRFFIPNAEVACLIREKFGDFQIKTMGFWRIIVKHRPIKDSNGCPGLLNVDRTGIGNWLDLNGGRSGSVCDRDDGFAFVASYH